MNAAALVLMVQILRVLTWAPEHKTPGQFVFQSRDEMSKIWVADGRKEADMPAVDFEKETVLAVFAGQKNSGGYGIKIEKVFSSERQDKARVGSDSAIKGLVTLYRETAPPPGSVQTRALTYPNHVVVINKDKYAELRFAGMNSDIGKKVQEWIEKALKKE